MSNIVVVAAFCVGLILFASGLIYYLVRTLRREDEFFQEYRDRGVTTVLHTKDPFWHTDQHGRYMEFDDGHRLYWSKDFDADGVSS